MARARLLTPVNRLSEFSADRLMRPVAAGRACMESGAQVGGEGWVVVVEVMQGAVDTGGDGLVCLLGAVTQPLGVTVTAGRR